MTEVVFLTVAKLSAFHDDDVVLGFAVSVVFFVLGEGAVQAVSLVDGSDGILEGVAGLAQEDHFWVNLFRGRFTKILENFEELVKSHGFYLLLGGV